jgi:hypothetical protein
MTAGHAEKTWAIAIRERTGQGEKWPWKDMAEAASSRCIYSVQRVQRVR